MNVMAKIKTSEKILKCATRLFAQHGYDGTIMDDLAEQCGVNKASIYYHHKDKATLYENALIALFTPIADAVVAAVSVEDDPVTRLESHIRMFARASADNPYFSAILMRELASGGANMPVSARRQMERVLALLGETLLLGESKNIFKPAETLIIHFMIVGTINLFVTSIPFRKSLPGASRADQRKNFDIESAAAQISKIIIDSLLLK